MADPNKDGAKEPQRETQALMIRELLLKSSHSAEFLVRDLRGLAHYSNQNDDRALNLLIRQLVEQACKISATLSELQPQ